MCAYCQDVLVSECRYAVVDVETTRRPVTRELAIIEIGIIHLNGFESIEAGFHSLINPECPVEHIDQNVTGLTDDDLRLAPRFDEIMPLFMGALEGRPILAHNAAFDAKAMTTELARIGKTAPAWTFIDTLKVARKIVDAPSHSLGSLVSRLGLPVTGRHRAMADCEAVARLFIALAARLETNFGIRRLAELYQFMQSHREPRGEQLNLL